MKKNKIDLENEGTIIDPFKATDKSKNVIFPAKLSFQERYPVISKYKTPDYIKKLRGKKNEQSDR